nr:MAG TPA: hypothetical protein [Caudoviricetes sp.]
MKGKTFPSSIIGKIILGNVSMNQRVKGFSVTSLRWGYIYIGI